MISRTVATAVKIGRFCKRGASDGNVVPATDGSAQSFLVFGEKADADVEIAVGRTVDLPVGDEGRDFFAILGDTVTEFQQLMPDANGAAIPATTTNFIGAIALKSGVAGDIIPVLPARGYYKT